MKFPEVRRASRGADLDLGIPEVAHQRPREFPRCDAIFWIRPGAVELRVPNKYSKLCVPKKYSYSRSTVDQLTKNEFRHLLFLTKKMNLTISPFWVSFSVCD